MGGKRGKGKRYCQVGKVRGLRKTKPKAEYVRWLGDTKVKGKIKEGEVRHGSGNKKMMVRGKIQRSKNVEGGRKER